MAIGRPTPDGTTEHTERPAARLTTEITEFTEPKTCLMFAIDPFPQSSDGGALLQEWKDEWPPVGASRRTQ